MKKEIKLCDGVREQDYLECVLTGIVHICPYKFLCLAKKSGYTSLFREVLEEHLRKDYLERAGLEIKEPSANELIYFEENLCDEDRAELLASGVSFQECVSHGEVYLVRDSVSPLVVYGMARGSCDGNCTEKAQSNGVIWMLCTTRTKQYPRAVLKVSRAYIKNCLTKVDYIFNYVWEKSVRARRFLEAMGFLFDVNKYICPRTGEVFLRFYKKGRKNV